MKNLCLVLLAFLIPVFAYGQLTNKLVTKEIVNLNSNGKLTAPVDTTLPCSQIHNPLYAQFNSWSELGNAGMPAVKNRYTPLRESLAPFAQQGYEPYAGPSGIIQVYHAKSPFTMFNYNSGGSQDKHGQTIRGIYARDLKKQGNLTVLGSYINSDGHFASQKSNMSALQANYSLSREKYSLIAGLSRIKFNSGENGGLKSDQSLIGTTYPNTLPVNLSAASSTSSMVILQGLQTGPIRLRKEKAVLDSIPPIDSIAPLDSKAPIDSIAPSDSLAPGPMKSATLRWEHQFTISDFSRKYIDKIPPSGFYPLVTGSLKNFADSMRFTSFCNRISIVPDTLRILGNRLTVKGGITPDLFRYQYGDTATVGFRLGISGEMSFHHKNTDVGFSGNWIAAGFSGGDYRLAVTLSNTQGKMNPENLLVLRLFSSGSSPDPFIRNFQSTTYSWNNLFARQFETGLDIGWHLKKAALEMTLTGIMDKNRIYFNEQALPAQAQESSLTGVLQVIKHLKAGPFRSEIDLSMQYTTSPVIPIPLFTGYTSTYMHHDLNFATTKGSMELEYGLDLRYNTPFKGYAYMPSTGLFYLQNEIRVGNYPWLDLFAQIKVKRTRIFVQWCHTFSSLMAANSFPVAHYPYMRPHLKYGVYWHFYD